MGHAARSHASAKRGETKHVEYEVGRSPLAASPKCGAAKYGKNLASFVGAKFYEV
jgi:hypothetical protein